MRSTILLAAAAAAGLLTFSMCARAGGVREDLNRLIEQWAGQGLTMNVSALEEEIEIVSGIDSERARPIALCVTDKLPGVLDGKPIPKDVWDFCKTQTKYERQL
jgi:hypothetical protein